MVSSIFFYNHEDLGFDPSTPVIFKADMVLYMPVTIELWLGVEMGELLGLTSCQPWQKKPAQNASTNVLDILGSMACLKEAGGHVELPECPAWLSSSCITEPTYFRRPLEDLMKMSWLSGTTQRAIEEYVQGPPLDSAHKPKGECTNRNVSIS